MATVDLKCAPDLPHVASHARNAEYNPRRFSAAIMRLREPAKATGLLFGTGKLCLTGVKSEDDARHAARKIAKIVQKLGFNAGFADFKIQNMVATGDVGFPVRLEGIADTHRKFSSVSGQGPVAAGAERDAAVVAAEQMQLRPRASPVSFCCCNLSQSHCKYIPMRLCPLPSLLSRFLHSTSRSSSRG